MELRSYLSQRDRLLDYAASRLQSREGQALDVSAAILTTWPYRRHSACRYSNIIGKSEVNSGAE